MTNFGDRRRLTVGGLPVGRMLPDPDEHEAPARRPAPASSSSSPTDRSTRPAASGWPGAPASAWPASAASPRTARERSSSAARPGCAPNATSSPTDVPIVGTGARPVLRGGRRGDRGGRAQQPARGDHGGRARRQHLARAAVRRRCARLLEHGRGGDGGGAWLTGAASSYWIPMADGTRLAATVYLPGRIRPGAGDPRGAAVPQGRPDRRLPAGVRAAARRVRVRRRAGRRPRDRARRRASPPTNTRPQEQQDLGEVIAWIAAQPWCTGSVGMYGTSYSGFNSLHLAADPTAGAQGGHRDLRQRRPLHRRRPLHGRPASRRSTSSTTRCTWSR